MKILPNFSPHNRLVVVSLLLLAFMTSFARAQDDSQIDTISQAELEQILAPIALYPDTVLSHILVASTYPLEVVQAERWIMQNQELQGQDAVAAAQDNDWDPSVQALVAFPQILKRMSQDLDWTQRLGDAFLQNEEQVLASVQNLRELAEVAGSLDEMEKVTVTHDERTIIIEPREREVVYVPYYDTRVVYGDWRWRNYQPIYWDYPYADSPYYNDYYAYNRRNAFYWGPRVSLSFGFFSNNFHWRDRHIVRISPRHHRPTRYYGYRDIRDHRYAERWVHDPRRRHVRRNSHIIHRDYNDHRSGRHNRSAAERRVHGNVQQQRNSSRQHSNPLQVQSQLANRRNGAADNRNVRRIVTPQDRPVTNRNTSTYRSSGSNSYPSRNSRVVLPGRANAIEDVRTNTNQPATRPINRQATVQRQANRATPAPVQQRPTPSPVQRSAPTPAPGPAAKPAVSRSVPKAAAAERKPGPQKAQSATRSEKRQPR